MVGGTILRGTIKEGDNLLIGPNDDGLFFPVTVGSIHRNRLPCRLATAGQSACVSIGKPIANSCPIRKVGSFSVLVFLLVCVFDTVID